MKKRALIISGGGAWGAFGAGTLASLNKDYKTVVGISTGALMSPLVALKKWGLLKNAYTSITQDNIFDRCWYKFKPISSKGKIRKFPIIWSLLLGDSSVATSNNLRKLVDEFFDEHSFNELNKQNKEVIVGTQNYAENPSKLHFFSSQSETCDDFKDWMWCSANAPFFTSLVKKSWKDNEGNFHVGQWTDGGLTELVAIDEIMSGVKYSEVDIVIHRNKPDHIYEGFKADNLIDNITRGIAAMRYVVEYEGLYQKIEKLNNVGTDVRVWWLPRKLSPNALQFDKKLMSEWWEEGFDTANDPQRIDYFPAKK